MSKTMKGLIAGLIVLALATAGVVIYARLSEPDYSKVPYPTVTITMENGDEIHLELYPDVAQHRFGRLRRAADQPRTPHARERVSLAAAPRGLQDGVRRGNRNLTPIKPER